MNEFYQPYYDFDQEPIQQGWLPDQNINTNQIYESPYDLQYENQVNADIQNQFQNYMQQRAMQEQQLQKKHQSQYYQIKSGDTLSQIARAHGVSVEKLAKLNGIKNINMIKSGQLLRFDNNVNNRYKSTFRKRNVQSNPTQVQKQVKSNTKSNDTTSSKVTTAPKRPVKNKITNTVRYDANKITPKKNTSSNAKTSSFPDRYKISKARKYNTNEIKKPRSFRDILLNIGRRINAENQRKRLYDRNGNYIKK